MSNRRKVTLYADQEPLTYVDSFIYLGTRISFDQSQMLEINRRIASAWRGFNRFSEFLTNRRVEMRYKVRVYRMCVVPALLFGCELWSFTKAIRNRLIVAQRSIMRKMCGVTRLDRKTNQWLSLKVPIPDIRVQAMHRKWNWAQRLALLQDDRWAKRIMEWTPYNRKRSVGRPKARWRDEIVQQLGATWATTCTTKTDVWKNCISQQALTLTLTLQ